MAFKKNFVAVIKNKGSILRETGDIVLLPFGSEYTILLKNLEARKVIVDIDIDGINILDGNSIIVEPNSTLELKGFMKGMGVTNKFKFIRKTQEISSYRGDRVDDGIVRIEFKFEKEVKIIDEYISRRYKPFLPPQPPVYWVGDNTPNIVYTDSSTAKNNDLISFCYSNQTDSKNYIESSEDGITVKGSKINQEFIYGNIEELEEQASVIIFKLRGIIYRGVKINEIDEQKDKEFKKVVTVKELKKAITVNTRLRCETCGRKSKSNAKFCSNCGTCLV